MRLVATSLDSVDPGHLQNRRKADGDGTGLVSFIRGVTGVTSE